MAAEGFYLRNSIPTEYGGLGVSESDWRYNALTTEELEHLGVGNLWLNLGSDATLPYFTKRATMEQRTHWLTKIVKESSILAIAMSEPEVRQTRSDRQPVCSQISQHQADSCLFGGCW
jgi:alkylation response protein AidB-like acyl-CoA dehydrogenase